MTTRARWVARRLLEIFDWRTFAVAGAFAAVLLVGYTLWSAFSAAHDATTSADQRGKAASRRIDKLNAEIKELQAAIAAGQDQRGQLATAVLALQAQVRQLGGQPVIVVTYRPFVSPSASQTPHPTATPTPQPRPRPTPSRTHAPSPTPSPTCTRLPVLGACRPKR